MTFIILLVKQFFGSFRFTLIFSFHFAHFLFVFASDFADRFDAKQTKSCLFMLPTETKLSLDFNFSLPE